MSIGKERTPVGLLWEIAKKPRVQAGVAALFLSIGGGDLLSGIIEGATARPPSITSWQLSDAEEDAANFEKTVRKAVEEGATIIRISDLTDPQQLRKAYGIIDRVQEFRTKDLPLDEVFVKVGNLEISRGLRASILALVGGVLGMIAIIRSIGPNPQKNLFLTYKI